MGTAEKTTLLQNIKRRQEDKGGTLVKRRLLGGPARELPRAPEATTAAAALAAAQATAALRQDAPRREAPQRLSSVEDSNAGPLLEKTPQRVTTPLRVYTRKKSRRRSLSSGRASASVNSTMSSDEEDQVVTAQVEVEVVTAQPAKRMSVEERWPATPQRCSVPRSGPPQMETPAPAEEADELLSPPAPPSPTSVQRSRAFESCSICCEETSAGSAVRLSCGHGWYCTSCLKSHAEARLEMGSVDVCCPQCNASIAERTLRIVLPDTLVERLLKRSLEQAVSAAGDLYACPTPNCHFRVALEDGDVPRLKCPECQKTCCLLCGKQPYHRGRTCQEAAVKRRDSGEAALKRWMEDTGSKQCPTCSAIVTKQNLEKQSTQYVECHKMMCRNCETKFCFKCLKVLSGKVACSCSRAEHGFIHPKSGRRLNHVKPKAKAKTKTRR